MKVKLSTLFLMLVGFYATIHATDLYRPSRNVELRLPSVPLIVSDPNFSIWSPCDKLMDGTTLHWTDAPKSLIGALRVDGKSYRFLGKEKLDLQAIAPMTDTEIWEGTFLRKKPADNWISLDFDDKEWKHGKAAFGSRDLPRVHTEWSEQNSDIYVRRTFDINELESERDFYRHFRNNCGRWMRQCHCAFLWENQWGNDKCWVDNRGKPDRGICSIPC